MNMVEAEDQNSILELMVQDDDNAAAAAAIMMMVKTTTMMMLVVPMLLLKVVNRRLDFLDDRHQTDIASGHWNQRTVTAEIVKMMLRDMAMMIQNRLELMDVLFWYDLFYWSLSRCPVISNIDLSNMTPEKKEEHI